MLRLLSLIGLSLPTLAACELGTLPPCVSKLSPVCGSNGVTYWNRCIMSNSPDTPTEFIPGPCATVGMKSYCNLIKCDKSPFQRVCGSDGFEYSSRCQAERMQCFEASLSWIDEPCDDLDTPKSNSSCLRVSGDGSGVCGSDQYFYESECIFEYAQKTIPNLTKVNDGKCTECNMYCLDNYDPVCGYSRGIEKSYPNECARKNEICEDPTIKPC